MKDSVRQTRSRMAKLAIGRKCALSFVGALCFAGAGFGEDLSVTTGTKDSPGVTISSSASYGVVDVGRDGATGSLLVNGGATLTTEGAFNIAQGGGAIFPAYLTVDGATVNVGGTLGIAGQSGESTEEPKQIVTLKSGAVLNAGAGFWRGGDSTTRYVFDGGSVNPGSGFWECVFQSNERGDGLQLEATAGNFIDISINGDKSLTLFGWHNAAPQAFGAGGFKKSGDGKLKLSSGLSYSGDTILASGTLKLTADNPLPYGAGKGIFHNNWGWLDLNGYTLTLNDFVFQNGNANVEGGHLGRGTLRLGADGRDLTAKAKLTSDSTLGKVGGGVMTLAYAAPSTVNVEEGTLRLGVRGQQAYSRYRFKVLRAIGIRADSVQFSEFRLMNGGLDVTRDGLVSVGRAATGSAPDQEGPAKAVDGDLSTKFLDFNGQWESSGAGEEVYVECVYSTPKIVTHYAFATAGDMLDIGQWNCRTPRTFQLLASNDGDEWTVLDERYEFVPPTEAQKWTQNFALGGPELASASAINVSRGATLDVCSDATITAIGKNEGTVNVEEGATLALSASGAMIDGALTGSGTLAFANAEGGDSIIVPRDPFPGAIKASGGRVVIGAPLNAKYFKFEINRTAGDNGCVQMTELALYDAAGSRVNGNLTLADGFDARNLSAGTCCAANEASQGNPPYGETVEKLFDGSADTKWCCPDTWLYSDEQHQNPANWRTICMRLADDAAPVVSYRIQAGNDVWERDPSGWVLYMSSDGVRWVEVARQDNIQTPDGRLTWYPAEADCGFNSAADLPAVNCAASGGAIEYGVGAKANGLTVEYGQSAGTIANFSPAESGRVDLVGVPAGTRVSSYEVPVTFINMSNPRNIRKWPVYVNGVEVPTLRFVFEDGKGVIRKKGGLVLIVE